METHLDNDRRTPISVSLSTGLGILKTPLRTTNDVLPWFKKLETTSQSGAYANIGIAYHCLGRLHEAVKNYLQDRKISIEIGDKAGQGRACANLGMAYFDLGDFKNALTFYQQDLSFAEAAKDLTGQGRALCNIARVFYSQGDLVLAETFFQMSLTFTEKMRSLLRSKDDCKISLRDL